MIRANSFLSSSFAWWLFVQLEIYKSAAKELKNCRHHFRKWTLSGSYCVRFVKFRLSSKSIVWSIEVTHFEPIAIDRNEINILWPEKVWFSCGMLSLGMNAKIFILNGRNGKAECIENFFSETGTEAEFVYVKRRKNYCIRVLRCNLKIFPFSQTRWHWWH